MAHINEKLDLTAEVFIVHEGRVLLRKHDKYRLWLSIGGHIEPNEDPNEAALREVREEVGLTISLLHNDQNTPPFKDGSTSLIPPVFMNRHRINDTHEHATFVYFAEADTDVIQQGKTEVSDEIKWFSKEDLDDPHYDLRDNIKFYAKKALEKLS